jgi:rare lipoprotein A
MSVASCASTQATKVAGAKPRSKEYFSEKEYGVKASPRVVQEGQPVPKGGGRYMVGDPYEVKGKTYVPKEDTNYNKNGLASWYGSAFHGRVTANGEVYDSAHLSAASPTFPLPSYARVTNLDTGTSVIVRVNDRGPYHPGRIIDLSGKAAELLDVKRTGTANVNVKYIGRARMDGNDMPYLMASYVRKGDRLPSVAPEGQIASGVMVASNQPLGDQLQSYGSGLPSPVAYSGRTPSGSGHASSAARTLQAFDDQNRQPPHAAPRPSDRPSGFAPAARQPQRAAAAPTYVAAAEPTHQITRQQVRQPVQAQPLTEARPAARPQFAQAEAPRPAPRANERPVRTADARPAAQRAPAHISETAYANTPRSPEPIVMFGNMVLKNPSR